MDDDGASERGVPVRVGAVDDHPVMLTGIRTELAPSDPDLVFGRTAATVAELLATGEQYDVVLLDLRLGDGSRPLDNVSRLRAAGPVDIIYTDGLDNAAGREVLSAVLQSAPRLPAALSEREAEALRLYASNLPAKSFARRMGVSEGTAKEYLKRVRAKYTALDRPSGTKLDLYHRALGDGVLPAAAEANRGGPTT